MATLADLLIKIGIDPKGVDKGSSEVESKLKRTWGKVAAGAAIGGAAIGGALMAGVGQMIEQSKAGALLSAQLGAGTPMAGEAGKAAGLLYSRGFVATMEDASAAVKGAVQNALVPPNASATEIDKVAARIANLGGVMEEDAGKVSAAVSQMIRTGMVQSAEEGFDLLHRGVELGINKSEDLLDTFNEYSTVFRDIGIGGPQAMGLMSQALKAGARDSDTAADALKEFAIRAQDGSKTSAEGFKALGLDAEKMTATFAKGGDVAGEAFNTVLERLRAIKDPVERNATAVALFGTKAEDLGDSLFAMNLDTATDQLGNLEGAAGRAGDALEQSAGAKLESFKRKAQTALIEQLAKAVPYIEKTFGWLSRNSSWVTPLAIGLGALATAIGLVVLATKAWGIALAVTPIGWIIIGITALVAAIVYLATKTQFFQTIWKGVWGFLKAVGAWFAGPFVDFFKRGWSNLVGQFNSAKARVVGIINMLKTAFAIYWTTYSKIIGWIISKGKSMVDFFVKMPGRIRGALSGMFNGLWSGFRGVVNKLIGGWNRLQFTIGGGSFAGITFPSATFGTPNIPFLAEGGIVTGPTLAMIGEGRSDEAVIPLDRGLPELAGRDERPVVVEITPGGERDFRRWINKTVRVRGAVATAKAG